ncbi:MAG: STAS domain-containing protein [Kineosporiaceae bacterium]
MTTSGAAGDAPPEEGRELTPAQVRRALATAAGGVVVVDLSRVPSPSSVTVEALLEAQRACGDRGLRLELHGLSRQGRRLFRDAGLAAVFDLQAPRQGRA